MKNNWSGVGQNGERNRSTEYVERSAEDRLGQAGRRKNKKAKYIFIMLFYMVVLVVVMYLAGVFFEWVNGELDTSRQQTQQVANMVEGDTYQETYTFEEMNSALEQISKEADARVAQAEAEADTRVEQAVAEAEERAAQAVSDREQEILTGIKNSLSEGDSTVEALRPFYPDEIVLASNGKIHFVPINRELNMNNYSQENLQILENGEYQYVVDDQVISHKGIDVSRHQGDIDWNRVAADGVEFAFIRAGLRGYGTGKLVEDENFEDNIKGATQAGIAVGVYVYSQAITEEEVMEEAALLIDCLEPYDIDCPIVIDVEKVAGANGRMNQLTPEERTNLVLLFCQTVENAGYTPMIYHNTEMGALMLDISALEKYDKWFASYSETMYYPYEYTIWQYSDKGSVDGIKTEVDLNISFSKFWEE